MSVAVEITPESERVQAWTSGFLSRADYANITDTGYLEDSFYVFHMLQALGVKSMVNIACRNRRPDELRSYVDRAVDEGATDIVILAGDRWSGEVRPTDLMKYVTRHPVNIGAVLNPSAVDMKKELELAGRKYESGAVFFMTQPVWDYSATTGFYGELSSKLGNVPAVHWGLFPARDFEEINSLGINGVNVPGYLVEISKNGKNALQISRDLYDEFHSGGSDLYVMGRRYATIEKIL